MAYAGKNPSKAERYAVTANNGLLGKHETFRFLTMFSERHMIENKITRFYYSDLSVADYNARTGTVEAWNDGEY